MDIEPTGMPKAEVEELALNYRKKFFDNDTSPQEAYEKIFAKYDGSIEYDENEERSETLQVFSDYSFDIFLPFNSSNVRDNFTIAHELGHYFLHVRNNKLKIRRVAKFNRKGSDRLEWEANWFAAEFLMPHKEFKKEAEGCNKNVMTLARKFGVSASAVQVRLSSLQL